MSQSAVWKIENGEPRRRITLDEAVAFANVFDVSLDNLLLPAEAVESQEMLDAIKNLARLTVEADAIAKEVAAAEERLQRLSRNRL